MPEDPPPAFRSRAIEIEAGMRSLTLSRGPTTAAPWLHPPEAEERPDDLGAIFALLRRCSPDLPVEVVKTLQAAAMNARGVPFKTLARGMHAECEREQERLAEERHRFKASLQSSSSSHDYLSGRAIHMMEARQRKDNLEDERERLADEIASIKRKCDRFRGHIKEQDEVIRTLSVAANEAREDISKMQSMVSGMSGAANAAKSKAAAFNEERASGKLLPQTAVAKLQETKDEYMTIFPKLDADYREFVSKQREVLRDVRSDTAHVDGLRKDAAELWARFGHIQRSSTPRPEWNTRMAAAYPELAERMGGHRAEDLKPPRQSTRSLVKEMEKLIRENEFLTENDSTTELLEARDTLAKLRDELKVQLAKLSGTADPNRPGSPGSSPGTRAPPVLDTHAGIRARISGAWRLLRELQSDESLPEAPPPPASPPSKKDKSKDKKDKKGGGVSGGEGGANNSKLGGKRATKVGGRSKPGGADANNSSSPPRPRRSLVKRSSPHHGLKPGELPAPISINPHTFRAVDYNGRKLKGLSPPAMLMHGGANIDVGLGRMRKDELDSKIAMFWEARHLDPAMAKLPLPKAFRRFIELAYPKVDEDDGCGGESARIMASDEFLRSLSCYIGEGVDCLCLYLVLHDILAGDAPRRPVRDAPRPRRSPVPTPEAPPEAKRGSRHPCNSSNPGGQQNGGAAAGGGWICSRRR